MMKTLIALAVAATTFTFSTAQANSDLSNVCPNPIRMADTGIEGMAHSKKRLAPLLKRLKRPPASRLRCLA
ncbi:hypothetical protein Q9247_15055 [Halomonas meridiana]|uniref:hypothetical protein n=1 Tax=Vreelandella aquamarina TaxID=77097 RepID=UPI00273CDDE8|nr:hypothetical protein [Halomonas meridiana]MDP4558993.1 hypothetical protein [Halomonas meridiana]